MDALERIAERKLLDALAQGELDDYAGKGEPLDLEDLTHVPEDLRAGYLLLKSHGFVPEDAAAHHEIVSLGRLIQACSDEPERARLDERRRSLRVRFALALEARGVPSDIVERLATIGDLDDVP